MPKKVDDLAHQRITDHEKLCRIMQKQTHDKIEALRKDVCRLEKILIGTSGFLLTSMLGIIVALLFRVL
jgi:hypothetical protein|tara:strand:- start:38 stop:244 length:207 start_codon:yes stop_codon:yes gene_type:complete